MKSMMKGFHSQVYHFVSTRLVIKFYREFFVIPLFEFAKINYD